jgi:hypothetical protein
MRRNEPILAHVLLKNRTVRPRNEISCFFFRALASFLKDQ